MTSSETRIIPKKNKHLTQGSSERKQTRYFFQVAPKIPHKRSHLHSCDTHKRCRVFPDIKGHHALDGCLGRSRNIVRQRTGCLDLHDSDDTNGESKDSGNHHGTPKEGREHFLAHGLEKSVCFKVGHEGHEQDAGVDIVVKGQLPVVVVDGWENLFGKDRIETHKEGRANSKSCSNHGEIHLSLGPHEETANDNEQAKGGFGRGRASENDLTQGNVEDDS